MPHNIIITKPGKMLEVAQAAERMATQADAFAKHFIPDSPHILYASKMLQSRQIERLTFIAPKEEGEYPYVCTFPGHWRTMSGKMIVVKDVEEYLVKNPIPEPIQIAEPRPFVRDWKFDDLTSALAELDSGRSFNNGKKLFAEIACVACHRMNEIGGIAGPDLAKLEDKVKIEDILRSMTEPSKEIKEKYQSYVIVTDDGKQTIGMVLENTDKFVKVMPNPLGMVKCEPIVLQKESIEFMKKSKISLMPEGLLKTMSKDEILDLIAYVESRGNPKHALYQK
jgi:putative heme-binding domain-containing protein